MLKKKERLSRKDFSLLLQKGTRKKGTCFSIVFLDAPEMKCGVVVGKKIAKQAVLRNIVRRRIFAILGEQRKRLLKKHVAILTYPSVDRVSYIELQQEINRMLFGSNDSVCRVK